MTDLPAEPKPEPPIDTSHPLYLELMAIGHAGRLREPDALLDKSELLVCQAVRSRTADHASEADRAQAARVVLLEFIDALVSPREKLVAQAALASESDYDGMNIEGRISELSDHKLRITRAMFQDTRRAVFQRFVGRLLRPLPPTSSEPVAQPAFGDPGLASHPDTAVEILATAAADLHFAARSMTFRSQRMRDVPYAGDLIRTSAIGSLERATLEAYARFVGFFGSAFTYTYLAGSPMSVGDYDALRTAVTQARALTPPSLVPYERRFASYTVGIFLEMPPVALLPLGGGPNVIEEVHNDLWWPWLRKLSSDEAIAIVNGLAQASRAACTILIRAGHIQKPLRAQARRSATLVLTYSYEIPDDVSLGSLRFLLRDRINAHFDAD